MNKKQVLLSSIIALFLCFKTVSANAEITREDVTKQTSVEISERLRNGEFLAKDVDLPDGFFSELRPRSANENKETIWNYLIGKGLSRAGAAGVIGNLEWESSCMPNNLEDASNQKSGVSDAAFTLAVDNGSISRNEFITSSTYGVYSNGTYGYGLAQWTYSTRKEALYDYAKNRGTSIGNLQMQLDFMWQEMSSSLKSTLTSSSDYSDACVIFHNVYEGSADDASRIAGRIALAKAVYESHSDPDHVPEGCFDIAEGGNGTVRVRGWVFDRDNVNASVKVHVYIGGPSGSGEGHEIVANKERTDVGNAYSGVGNYHGFDEVIETNKRGSQEVHVYGIDVGNFVRNPELSNSPKTVVINEKPKYAIDLNGYLDGSDSGSISGYGTVDIYVGGTLMANDVDDFFSKNGTWVTGTTYEIKDIKPKPGYSYNGVHSGNRSGTIGSSTVTISLDFTKNDLDSITEKPQARYYNGHTYFYYSSPVTWYFAKEFCESKGGHLVSIENAEEDAFALSLFETGNNVWIGANDEAAEGNWIWTTGEPVTYTNWINGNPDNYSGEISDRKNFVHYNWASQWNDDKGADKFPFICEFDFIDHEHSLIKIPAKDATCEVNGNITYWYCDICGNAYADVNASEEIILSSTVIPKLGHTYLEKENPPSCIDNGSTTYTCSMCGDSYTERTPIVEPEGSDGWTTAKPTDVPEDMIYAKTQYRYRTLETTTSTEPSLSGWTQTGSSVSYGDYGAWSGWSETKQSKTDTREVQTRTEYRYYYFYCPVCGGHEPLQGTSDCHQYTLSLSDGVVGWFPTPYSDCNPQSYSYTTYKKWTTSLGDGQRWNLTTADIGHTEVGYQGDAGTPIIRTAYRYRDRSKTVTYSYEKWGDWSSWGDTEYTASSTREVETRTVYKYDADRDNRHVWGEPEYTWDEVSGTLTAEYHCTMNESHEKTEVIENVSVMKLPIGTKEIEEEAFSGIASQVVIIPDGCTTIGSKAFADCPNLLYIEIPDSVSDIAEDAFSGSVKLTGNH